VKRISADALYSEARRLEIELAKRKLGQFCIEASEGFWTPSPLHLYLASIFEAAVEYIREEHDVPLLIRIHMPSRHGKSEIFSRYGPAWALLNHPGLEIIETSYDEALALDMSRDARAIDRKMSPLFEAAPLSKDSQAVSRWKVDGHRGKLQAAGVGGPIAGRGANLAIIDDPHKNRIEAESLVMQRRAIEWYRSVFRTRLHPGGVIFLVMHRWDIGDLAGRLERDELRGTGEKWKTYNFSAICDDPKTDPLGRAMGEALWPERFNKKVLAATKIGVGPRVWTAMYQQKPKQKIEGTLWTEKMIEQHRVVSVPRLVDRAVGVDPSGGEEGDEVGIVAGGRGENGHGYVLRDDSGHYTPKGWGEAALRAYLIVKADRVVAEKNYGGDLVKRNLEATLLVYWVEVDNEGYELEDGVLLFDEPAEELVWDSAPEDEDAEPGLYRRKTISGEDVSIVLVTATKGKVLRAEPVANKYDQGLVHHVGYIEDLEDEQTTWIGRGPKKSSKSPNRIDAVVWLLTDLLFEQAGGAAEFVDL
jgi:hypothetical protein